MPKMFSNLKFKGEDWHSSSSFCHIPSMFRKGNQYYMPRKKVGEFSLEIIKALELDIPVGTPIYIADSNIEHMKSSHPDDFIKYGGEIKSIIASPDYVGKNIKDNSIEFTKEYMLDGNFVKVAVRVSLQNIYYTRSLYVLNPNHVKNFIAKGTLKKLDK